MPKYEVHVSEDYDPQPPRQIVQITAITPASTPDLIIALCNDGTLWSLSITRHEWKQYPPIPQPGDE